MFLYVEVGKYNDVIDGVCVNYVFIMDYWIYVIIVYCELCELEMEVYLNGFRVFVDFYISYLILELLDV